MKIQYLERELDATTRKLKNWKSQILTAPGRPFKKLKFAAPMQLLQKDATQLHDNGTCRPRLGVGKIKSPR